MTNIEPALVGAALFSAAPTAEEVFRARVFAKPFVPVGPCAYAGEKRRSRIGEHPLHDRALGDYAPFTEFLAQHPASSWTPSIQLNLGLRYFAVARFNEALAVCDAAWPRSKFVVEPRGKIVADRALAELLHLYAGLSRREVLKDMLAEIGDRTFTGKLIELIGGASRVVVNANAPRPRLPVRPSRSRPYPHPPARHSRFGRVPMARLQPRRAST